MIHFHLVLGELGALSALQLSQGQGRINGNSKEHFWYVDEKHENQHLHGHIILILIKMPNGGVFKGNGISPFASIHISVYTSVFSLPSHSNRQPANHAHMHMYFKVGFIILMRCTNAIVIYRSNILCSVHPDVHTVTHVHNGMSVCTGICNWCFCWP